MGTAEQRLPDANSSLQCTGSLCVHAFLDLQGVKGLCCMRLQRHAERQPWTHIVTAQPYDGLGDGLRLSISQVHKFVDQGAEVDRLDGPLQ